MVNIELAQKLEKQIMTVLNTAIVGEYKMVHYSYTLIHLSVLILNHLFDQYGNLSQRQCFVRASFCKQMQENMVR